MKETVPEPTDISGIRSFFGLVQQVSYTFTMTKPMAPFWDLLKSSFTFYWDDNLQNLFDQAKEVIIQEIEKGVKAFDKKKTTCIASDISCCRRTAVASCCPPCAVSRAGSWS